MSHLRRAVPLPETRKDHAMTSYRRYVAKNPEALSRAIRQIRRHSMETGPVRDQEWNITALDSHGRPLGQALAAWAENIRKSFRIPTHMVLHTEAGRDRLIPAECPDCSHPHVEGQRCMAATAGPFVCGCTA